jgi:hypothetical protein
VPKDTDGFWSLADDMTWLRVCSPVRSIGVAPNALKVAGPTVNTRCEGDGNLGLDGPFHGRLNGSHDLRSGLSPCVSPA